MSPEVMAVADEMLDINRQVGLRLSPVEHGDFMAKADQSTYHRRADEARAADDEDTHGIDTRSEAIRASSRR